MRNLLAALFVASLLIVVAAPVVQAAPTNVNVRIEGAEETLFERTIPVDIHKIKASSDTVERNCDGINELDPENVVPRVTPTLASVDAMSSIGETFDGQWYEGFGDYFITRWGPDQQDTVTGAYWGVLVNEVYINVGGCQRQLNENDEVLWIWDAFKGRPSLALYPEEAHYSAGPRPVNPIAQLGQPFGIEVVSFPDGGEGIPGDTPSRAGSTPYEGAEVAPVTTGPKGFQRTDTASAETVTTNSQGKAAIVFNTPGIHRIKATVGAPGEEETVVRSNRLDVCVPAAFGDCGEVALPPRTAAPASAPHPPAPTRVSKLKLDRSMIAQGKVKLSWKVLDPGAGVKRWQISSKTLGGQGGFIARASGKKQTSATIRLPLGAAYKLRFSLADVSGQITNYGLGKVTVPRGGQD